MISVVVADDQTLVRRGFASILDSTGGITVVGEAEHGLDATRRITSDPDLAARRISVLTTFDLDE